MEKKEAKCGEGSNKENEGRNGGKGSLREDKKEGRGMEGGKEKGREGGRNMLKEAKVIEKCDKIEEGREKHVKRSKDNREM